MKKIDDRTLTPALRKKILDKYDNICVYCFSDADQVDHLTPWSYRHDDSENNLVASCWLCNIIGSNKIFKTFGKKQEYIQKRRYDWIKRHPIPLWTKEELKKLGYALRVKTSNTCIILDTEEEKLRVKGK
ncbi:MAG: HNH endonuclease, partial [Deltaproteobacteria bacterium]|nr:HNH endonuclease [Deltaproteobacteria bacterium]